ncbi:Crp/Fnr family transcriptional regulator, partial [Xanthovirga aplysinae]|uniref:Crp/Fnr family transcriptional regulator n=1 Tax=Xanthovirga aplysinae TaxID=2529853 RepID=UPI0012BBAFFD
MNLTMEWTHIKQNLSNRFPYLTDADLNEFLAITEIKELKANEHFIKRDSLKKKVGLVLKGLLRGYYINEVGNETTIFFWQENTFVSTWEAMLLKKPCTQNIETIEPSVLLIFDYEKLKELMQSSPKIEKGYLETSQFVLAKSLYQLQTFLHEKPEKRYEYFVKELGFFSDRIPQKY